MATKLDTFLTDNKIDHRRLLAASRQIERLRPKDRTVKLKQRQARKSDDGKKPEDLPKPRSGRPVTKVALQAALSGGRLSGPTKTRFLRAVNHILKLRKTNPVELSTLFDVTVPPAADDSDS